MNNENKKVVPSALSSLWIQFYSMFKRNFGSTAFEVFIHSIPMIIAAIAVPLIFRKVDPLSKTKREVQRKAQDNLKSIQKRQKRSRTIAVNTYESIIASDIIMPENIDVTFDDIGGLDEVKLKLQESVILPLKYPGLFQRGKLLKIPRGILLFGEPGTGKTMLAKALSKTSEAAFINLNIANLTQKWFGESEKLVHATFTLAEKIQPTIIFIDEADSLFRSRKSQDHEVLDRIKALFMTLWDGLSTDSESQITIICATNRPWAIDEAIQRRMPHTYHIGMPDQSQREIILKIILKGEATEPNFDIKKLAEETSGYSGSDLMALCQAAARAPIREHLGDIVNYSPNTKSLRDLRLEDFLEAKKVVGPTGASANSFRNQQQATRNEVPLSSSSPTNVYNFNLLLPVIPNGNNFQQQQP